MNRYALRHKDSGRFVQESEIIRPRYYERPMRFIKVHDRYSVMVRRGGERPTQLGVYWFPDHEIIEVRDDE